MKDKLTKRSVERLIILNEECSELSKVICKIQRFGLQSTNQDELIQEIGDVIQMINIVCEELEIPWEPIEAAAKAKKEKLKHWTSY